MNLLKLINAVNFTCCDRVVRKASVEPDQIMTQDTQAQHLTLKMAFQNIRLCMGFRTNILSNTTQRTN